MPIATVAPESGKSGPCFKLELTFTSGEHPMKVTEIMTKPVVTAREDDTLAEVAQLMLANKIGCVPIVAADGTLSGIITAFDFVPQDYHPPFTLAVWRGLFGLNIHGEPIHEIYEAVRTKRAREVMNSPVVTVAEDDNVDTAVNKMVGSKINHLPVVRDDVPVGVITQLDLLSLLN
jgi:CBS domain-containing protein